MQRRVGATSFDMDARDGIVNYGIAQARTIDLVVIHNTLRSAGYDLRKVELEARGEVKVHEGTKLFRLPGTGQELPIQGETAHVGPTRLRGELKQEGDRLSLVIVSS